MSRQTVLYIVLIIFSIIMILPFFWMVLTSFKTLPEAMSYPPTWFPKEWRPQNYVDVMSKYSFAKYAWNTVLVALLRTVIQLIVCSLAAYAFACLRFPGKNALFMLYLSTLMVPFYAILIPSFMLVKSLGWIDSFYALIIPPALGGSMAFGTFMLRQFFINIPRDLIDASKIDGCSYARIYLQVILPLSKPALVTLGLLAFLWSWNDFIWPLIVTSSEDKWVLPIALSMLQGQYWTHIEYVMVGGTIATLPIIVIYILVQRYIIEGITFTGMGGI